MCKYWNERKGYGFISFASERARELAEKHARSPVIFVHRRDISSEHRGRLMIGDELEFSVAKNMNSGRVKATAVVPSLRCSDGFAELFDELFPLPNLPDDYAP